MPANFPMPAADQFRDVLGDLMGRGVRVVPTRPTDLGTDRPGALADYETDRERIGVVCIADLRLTNALGAALTMVAPNAVEDAVASQSIDQPTIDNFREVVNVLTSVFNTIDTPHLKFKAVHRLPAALPDPTKQLVDAPLGRRDFDVSIDDYGTGTLSVFVG